ncbi:phosphoglycerate mutase-like protein 4 [Chenopodium quinoa]|uniref:phosphoglycerate mutase-like protein 4 n=1 Tax=Chenopodium quinoa TaxID=63459 RepID=UPI000B775EA0|nr:phosphoglycerate mutase-like protein 4 [Chenopodium quinoa]
MAASDSRVTTEGVPTNESCTEFILVRHGETVWNAVGKMQGQLDIDLNEAGRQQAVAVAKRLSREPNISGIYSSDLKRALETAETIAATCGGLEVICDQDLQERHLGELQGVVYEESISKIYPKAHEALLSGEEIPGGGESHDQLYIRSIASLQRIAEKHRGARVIVVTHGEVIRILYRRILPFEGLPRISNTSVSILQLSEGEVWSFKTWNDDSHLREAEYLESALGGGAQGIKPKL